MTTTTQAREPRLLYSDVQDDLRDTLRRLLEDRCSWQSVLARVDAAGGAQADQPARATVPPAGGTDEALWRSVASDLGLAGLAVPQGAGGAGAGWGETAVVLEELGRSVAPVPYLGAAVATATLLALPGSAAATGGGVGAGAGSQEGAVSQALHDVASGTVTALAVPFSTAAGAPGGAGTVTAQDLDGSAGVSLTGTVTTVADAVTSELLLVRAENALWAVPTGQDGVTLHTLPSLDPTRPLCDVVLRRATGRRLAHGEAADAAVSTGLLTGAGLLASEQLGVASWCLEETVSYLRTRHQFGRPIGSYQALKHRLADLWVDVTQARAVARYAADCLAVGDPDTPVAVSLAQAHCSPLAVRAAEECVQLHGGIGFTWEHPAHLYLKRAKADSIAFGTAEHHRQTLASLVDLPAA